MGFNEELLKKSKEQAIEMIKNSKKFIAIAIDSDRGTNNCVTACTFTDMLDVALSIYNSALDNNNVSLTLRAMAESVFKDEILNRYNERFENEEKK